MVRYAPVLFVKVTLYSVMSMEGGLSVMGDWQCPYTGNRADTQKSTVSTIIKSIWDFHFYEERGLEI